MPAAQQCSTHAVTEVPAVAMADHNNGYWDLDWETASPSWNLTRKYHAGKSMYTATCVKTNARIISLK